MWFGRGGRSCWAPIIIHPSEKLGKRFNSFVLTVDLWSKQGFERRKGATDPGFPDQFSSELASSGDVFPSHVGVKSTKIQCAKQRSATPPIAARVALPSSVAGSVVGDLLQRWQPETAHFIHLLRSAGVCRSPVCGSAGKASGLCLWFSGGRRSSSKSLSPEMRPGKGQFPVPFPDVLSVVQQGVRPAAEGSAYVFSDRAKL